MPGLNLGNWKPEASGDSETRGLLRFLSGDPNELPSAVFERGELAARAGCGDL